MCLLFVAQSNNSSEDEITFSIDYDLVVEEDNRRAGHRRDDLGEPIDDFNAGGGGVARIDFLMNDNDELFVNEINNIPGSFSSYLWEHMGRSFTELLDRMIERAFEVRKRSHRTIYAFEANLLASK
jgi:hypothetical protein